MQKGFCNLASYLYIATSNAPLTDRFQEMLDMLMTGAAFGLPTTLWLTDDCLLSLSITPPIDALDQLSDFGVRSVVTTTPHSCAFPVELLDHEAMQVLREDCQQVLVF